MYNDRIWLYAFEKGTSQLVNVRYIEGGVSSINMLRLNAEYTAHNDASVEVYAIDNIYGLRSAYFEYVRDQSVSSRVTFKLFVKENGMLVFERSKDKKD